MMAFDGFGGSVCDLSFAKTPGIISLCVIFEIVPNRNI